MKECIYSIPLTDALDAKCGCILCQLEKKFEEDACEFFLGPAMMEPDHRELTNEKGFCKNHLPMLFNKSNRLGLALVLETHAKEFSSKFTLEKKNGFMKKGLDAKLIAQNILIANESCAMCDKINAQAKEAAANFAYMWDKEPDFRDKYKKQGTLCPEHASLVLSVCEKEVSGKNRDTFIEMIVKQQKDLLDSLYDDLHEFVLSFDYRNADKPLSEKASMSVQNAVKHLAKY